MAVEQHSVQAGLKLVKAAGGEQGGGVQGCLEKGHGFTLLLLRLAVGSERSQDPPAEPDLQHSPVHSVTQE